MQMKMSKLILYFYVMMNIITLTSTCTLPGDVTRKSDLSLVNSLRRALKKHNKLLKPESYYKEANVFTEDQCKVQNASTVIEVLYSNLDWVIKAKKQLRLEARAEKSADQQIEQAYKTREVLCRLLNRSKSEKESQMKISLISLKTNTVNRSNVFSFEFETIRKVEYLLKCLRRSMKKKGEMLFKHDLSCKPTPSCRKHSKKKTNKRNKNRKGGKRKGRKQRRRKQKGNKSKGRKSKVTKTKQRKKNKSKTKNARKRKPEST